MAHKIKDDDSNIIKKCRAHGFCCTYDTERDFEHKSVTDAIAAVLASRAKQSEKLNQLIIRTDEILDPLQKLIDNAGGLAQLSGNGIGVETSRQDVIVSYRAQLIKEKSCLDANLSTLKDTRRVMDRKHIRVPVVGVINSGKSTFLHSALGGGMSNKVKENLFPSAGAHKSCTGTRTVLIYDKDSEGVKVVAKFKDKAAFFNDCKQSVSRMVGVLEKLEVNNRFPEIYHLQDAFTDGADPIALLKGYHQSAEFHNLCSIRYKDEWDAESVHDFCSFVHFSKDQDYSEDRMDFGMPKTTFSASGLIRSWNEGTSYCLQIPSDHEFRAVRNFVCKYDPDMGQGAKRYTTYCGVQVVEIRGNLCGEIAGLELIDSVGANDDAISNKDQMRALMQDSDAMILLERPQPQARGKWSIAECIQFVKEQGRVPNQFLYLAYNCYNNNIGNPSDLSLDIDNAYKYYSEDCKRIYVSDIGEWEEVQSKMLVDMLVNLSNSVEETHKKYLSMAREADSNISASILAIRQTAESLRQTCIAEDENASEKKNNIDKILQQLFGAVEQLAFETRDEDNTVLRARANSITEKMIENLNLDSKPVDFNVTYEYISPAGPRYIYNRYVAFLCMYSHMLEDVKRQYSVLKNDISVYVGKKRQKLLDILWERGRFKSIMSGLSVKNGSLSPDAEAICGWLRKDAKELLADVLEDLLLQDIGAESLIDGSIGKVIERFDPKNLTVEQLFGQQMSDPDLENNENSKADAIAKRLSMKADELKKALLESVNGTAGNSSDIGKNGQGSPGKKKEDDSWDKLIDNKLRNDTEKSGSGSIQDASVLNDNIFDLDKKVRKDVVCDGILKKFRDKMRGDGLPQNAEPPISQLYNLYDHYYDVLLSKEEASYKKRLNELRHHIDGSAKQLITLCQS